MNLLAFQNYDTQAHHYCALSRQSANAYKRVRQTLFYLSSRYFYDAFRHALILAAHRAARLCGIRPECVSARDYLCA